MLYDYYYSSDSDDDSSYDNGDSDLIYENDGYVACYIDGACARNGQWNASAGIGVVFNFDHPNNHSGPVKGRATNNAAEIQAATWAINEAIDLGINQLRLFTDSEFLVNAVNHWLDYWKQNRWYRSNGMQLANKRDFIKLDRAMENANMDIDFVHINGHSGNALNEFADELARKGAKIYKRINYNNQ